MASIRKLDIHIEKKKMPWGKMYLPWIDGKRLCITWDTKTKAEIYAQEVKNRYLKLLEYV